MEINHEDRINMGLCCSEYVLIMGIYLASKKGSVLFSINQHKQQIIDMIKFTNEEYNLFGKQLLTKGLIEKSTIKGKYKITEKWIKPTLKRKVVVREKTSPDLEDVIDYFKKINIKNYKENAEKFWRHYESRDWIAGKTKIIKWKLIVDNWNFAKETIGYMDFNQHVNLFKK